MIRNILFDLGGVFIRLTREESVKRFEALGIHDADAMLDPYCQNGLFLDLESGKYTDVEFAMELSKRYNLSISTEDVAYALQGFVEHVQPEKFDYIDNCLPKDIQLLLVSNTNPYVHCWTMSTSFLPSGRDVESYFSKCYFSFQLKVCKPDPSLFRYIIQDANIDPAETLFVDDSPTNVSIARELGFVTYRPENGEDWRPILDKMLK